MTNEQMATEEWYDRTIVEGPIGAAVWKVAWPTMLQNIIANLQGIIDHMMVSKFVGHYGNAAFGAVLVTSLGLVLAWALLGFLQDFIAVAVAVSLGVFAIIRIRNAPARKDRASRFYGSHTGGAWLILVMIFNVVWTMFFFAGLAAVVLIGLVVENLVFRTIERRTVRRWGMVR